MDYSTPDFSVLNYLLEFPQIHVHWVGDALTMLSSATPFSFCLHSFLASGSFPVSGLFASAGQSIGASASNLPLNIWGWFPLGLTVRPEGIALLAVQGTLKSLLWYPIIISLTKEKEDATSGDSSWEAILGARRSLKFFRSRVCRDLAEVWLEEGQTTEGAQRLPGVHLKYIVHTHQVLPGCFAWIRSPTFLVCKLRKTDSIYERVLWALNSMQTWIWLGSSGWSLDSSIIVNWILKCFKGSPIYRDSVIDEFSWYKYFIIYLIGTFFK